MTTTHDNFLHKARPRRLGPLMAAWGSLFFVAACGERAEHWSVAPGPSHPVGLTGSVVLQDRTLDRVVFVTSPQDCRRDAEEDAGACLRSAAYPIGQNVTAVQASSDHERLFVLSRGEKPRTEPDDEPPQLMVFDGGAGVEERLLKRFELDDPMQQLSIDPRGEWVAAFEGDATVVNPNELVLLSLKGESDTAQSKTIRSFGGSPLELVFTSELEVPSGPARRFVVVRTDRDVTLIDLGDLDRAEVTVRLPEDEDGNVFAPEQIVFDDGDPDDPTDARLAVRLNGTSDVMLLRLSEPTSSQSTGSNGSEADADGGTKDFRVVPNIVDVGGIPDAIDFVRTDGGLRLAALVGNKSRATLVDPDTTLSETVELPHGFSKMRRITSVVSDAPEGGDVALLWGSEGHIAFWSLGSTSESPFRSIDSTELDIEIEQVIDVPAPNDHLKVLLGSQAQKFFVLDLKKRQSFPLQTAGQGFDVTVSPDGQRLWVVQPGYEDFSSVRLDDLHPASLFVEPGVTTVFDIAQERGGRAAVALHLDGPWAATWLDAEEPNSANTAYFPGLHFEGLK